MNTFFLVGAAGACLILAVIIGFVLSATSHYMRFGCHQQYFSITHEFHINVLIELQSRIIEHTI